MFEWDSLGRLTRAHRDDDDDDDGRRRHYDVRYAYDARGRLAMRRDHVTGHVTRFLYAHPRRPARLTHLLRTVSPPTH